MPHVCWANLGPPSKQWRQIPRVLGPQLLNALWSHTAPVPHLRFTLVDINVCALELSLRHTGIVVQICDGLQNVSDALTEGSCGSFNLVWPLFLPLTVSPTTIALRDVPCCQTGRSSCSVLDPGVIICCALCLQASLLSMPSATTTA